MNLRLFASKLFGKNFKSPISGPVTPAPETEPQDALGTSESRYRKLFESVRDGILLVDFDTGMILDVNQFLIDLLGYSKADFLEKHLWDIGAFKDVAASKEKFVELQAKKYVHYENLPLETKSGKSIEVEFVSYAYMVGDRLIQVIQCNVRDITKRKALEAVAIANEISYSDLFRSMNEGFAYCEMVYDKEGKPIDFRYLDVNPAFAKLTGLPTEKVVGQLVTEVIPGIEYFWIESYGRVVQTGQSGHFENKVETLGKQYEVNAWRSGEGRFAVVFNDVTDRKKEEERLKESEENFKNIFETAVDGILLIDLETRKFGMANKAICTQLGCSQEEIKNLGIKDIHPTKDFPHVFEQFNRLVKKEIQVSNNIPVKRKNGTIFYADITATHITISGKEFLMGIFRDVTERRNAEERLKEVDKNKTEFISIASHQLRTPISGMRWVLEEMERGNDNLTPKQKVYFEDLNVLTKRMVELLEDLLSFSRIELKTGAMTDKQPIELVEFIEEFMKEFEPYAVSKKRTIVVKNEFTEPINIEMNKKALSNVLQNLVANAVDYSPAETEVTINLEKHDGSVKISVSNTGPAIPKDEQPYIFDKFYRGESAKKIKAEGTGLGLYIVKAIIENLGGSVGFESRARKGTTFWFTIPLSEAEKKEK
jgi:PAS domain S-box-containing protein